MGGDVEDVVAIFINLFLPLALVVIMFSLGLGLGWSDFRRILEQPRAFAIGTFGHLIVLPAVALALILVFRPLPELAVGLMILSFCPGGMSSNMLTKLARGDVALAVSLTSTSTLIAILTMPILTGLAVHYLMGTAATEIDVTNLALQLIALTALPVAVGVAIKVYAPAFAAWLDPHASRVATLFFVIIVVAALGANWGAFLTQLARLGPILVLMFVLLLTAGYALAKAGRLNPEQTTAITIEVGIQNATMGMTVGALLVHQASALPAFSLPSAVYGAMMYVLIIPFIVLRRRWHDSVAGIESPSMARPV